jgi:8-oxo-dGTP pyrophosphatase MutT (NUDIX family)
VSTLAEYGNGARGGAQLIPRPDGTQPGALAPWHDLSEARRQLSLAQVRSALVGREPGSIATGAPSQPLNSAVIAPLYESNGDLQVLLTRRAWTLRSHAGEVSFPGGRQEPGESLWETAIREAHEEIDLPVAASEQLGELDRLYTVSSGSAIYAYVAFVAELPELLANADEVDAILRVSFAELTAPGVFREELWPLWSDELRPITFFEVEGDTIWGATATMLRQLICLALGLA